MPKMGWKPTHPNKPKTVFCRRSALMRWTGWSEKEIAHYVAEGKLRIVRMRPNSYPRYLVQSAQELIDEIESGKNPAAVAFGRLGGLKGGKARAAALSARKRKLIARKGAKARWKNTRSDLNA